MPTCFNLDSIAVHYEPADGNKRPFVFVHGNTQNDTCGKAVRAYFREQGHAVLSYDLPGHGDSILETVDYRFPDLVKLNQEILRHYQIKTPILCGHSLGGMIQASTIATFDIDDASLVLCGSYDGSPLGAAKHQPELKRAYEQTLDAYIKEGESLFEKQYKYDHYTNRHLDDETIKIINRRYTQPAASKANMKTLDDFNARKKLIELDIPVLVLHAKKETVIPKMLVDMMALQYQNIEFEWYELGDHNTFYQQPELTNSFLDRHYQFLTDQ